MSLTISPTLDKTKFSSVARGGIQKYLEANGRFPPVTLVITPLDRSKPIFLDRFLSYQFSSSILIPVDTFSFSFVAPDDSRPMNQIIREGDIATLYANGIALATGIIDQTEIETDKGFGEKGSVSGRDFLGQLEDQDCVTVRGDQIRANELTIRQAAGRLLENTRVQKVIVKDAPTKQFLFATEPGESKIAALQRFVEPLNCLFWASPIGNLIVGRPNMAQKAKGRVFVSKTKRQSNVMSIKVVRSSATIPNLILPIWTGQEEVQSRVTKQQQVFNRAVGPHRLYHLNHFLQKTVVISNPQGASPQDLSRVNDLRAAANLTAEQAATQGPKPAGSNLLQAYAKRELARHNQKEMIVEAVSAGHYDENGDPWAIDTVYSVEYDRGDVQKDMYLFHVEHILSEEGQTTRLFFCNKGTIVSDTVVK